MVGHQQLRLDGRGLFEHRLIHADPNLSNFSFLADGRVVVYDFGCVKSVPGMTRMRPCIIP